MDQPDELHEPEDGTGGGHADGTQLESEGEGVVGGVQGQPPGVRAVGVVQRHVSGLDQLEAHRGERVHALLLGGHVGQAVALLDLLLDRAVQLVVLVVLGRQAPLVAREHLSGLEHAEDLGVHTLALGGVAGGLDGVDTVEGVVGELVELHEIALHRGGATHEARRGVELVSALHLVL